MEQASKVDSPKILIVEDEVIVAEDVRRRLIAFGYDVPRGVATGEEALRVAASLAPDLAVVDILLQGDMDGIALARQLREQHHVPVVFLTACSDEPTLQRAKQTGSFGYLLKPFDDRELRTTIELALAEYALEKGVEESEQRFRLLFDFAPFGYQLLDSDLRIVEVNRTWLDATGYGRDDVIGNALSDMVAPETRAAVRDHLLRTRAGAGMHELEVELLRKDGTRCHTRVHTKVRRDSGGQCVHALCMFGGLDGRTRTEGSPSGSDSVLRAMVEDSPLVAVAVTDPTGVIEFWNAGAVNIFGRSADEVVGKERIHAFFPEGATAEMFEALHGSSPAGAESVRRELRASVPGGKPIWVELRVSARRDVSGSLVRVLAIGEDITERKQTEKRQAILYAIGEAAQSGQTLDELYRTIHQGISEILPARNFYIALHTPAKNLITFPYFVDEFDPQPQPKPPGRGLTEYVLRTGKPLLASPEVFNELAARGEVESIGQPSVDWLGVPLKIADRILGVLVVQTYSEGTRYTDDDMQILSFVSSQIAMAIDRVQKEQTLRTSEAELRSLFEHAVMGIIKRMPDGTNVSVNPTLARIYGYDSADELLAALNREGGQRYADARRHEEFAGRLRSEADIVSFESQVFRKDGSTVWISENVRTVRNMQGDVLYAIVTVDDITARKQAEKELRLLANTITCAKDCFVLSDLDRRILFVNEALLTTYGFTEQDLLGNDVAMLRSPDVPEALLEQMYSTSADGWNGELIHRRKDGTDFPVELWISLVRTDSGQPIAHVGVARDITARKRIEQAIYKSELQLRRITENMLDMICQLDVRGVCEYASPSIAKILGFGLQEVVGKPLDRFIYRDDLPRVIRLFRVLMQHPQSGKTEYRCRTAAGDAIWLESTINPLVDASGAVTGFVVGSVDVTDRKRAEETLILDESRLETLLKLNQMTGASTQQVTDFALEEAVRLTKSKIGYLAFMSEDGNTLTMHAWSKSAMEACAIEQKPRNFPLALTGIWGEPVRQRKPIIINAFDRPNPLKKGYPEGHVAVKRLLAIPIFDGERIVATAGVGNKEEEYNTSDVRQLTLLMEGMWLLLQRQQAEERIRTSLQEKEVLLKEVHHRVKNNLQIISSLLNLQTEHVKDMRALDVLRESQNRIRSMALIHERLYRSEDFSRVDFGQYVYNLTTFLFRSYAADRREFKIHVDIQDISLGVDVAIPCGLIVNELVTNCLKHAFPDGRAGEVTVMLHRDGDRYVLAVSDDGVGLPGNFDYKKAESLGLQLVETLSSQIGATVDVQTGEGKGTLFSMTFPATIDM